eukprot:6392863-Pyramimonas_sp.AAC.1
MRVKNHRARTGQAKLFELNCTPIARPTTGMCTGGGGAMAADRTKRAIMAYQSRPGRTEPQKRPFKLHITANRIKTLNSDKRLNLTQSAAPLQEIIRGTAVAQLMQGRLDA